MAPVKVVVPDSTALPVWFSVPVMVVVLSSAVVPFTSSNDPGPVVPMPTLPVD